MDADRSAFDIPGGSSFVTVRNNDIAGTESDGGGAGVDIAGEADVEIRYVMVYNDTFDDIGPSDEGASGAEAHQGRPSWYSRYVWVVNNTFGSSRRGSDAFSGSCPSMGWISSSSSGWTA